MRLVVFGNSKEEEKALTEKQVAGEGKRREARYKAATIRLWYLAMFLFNTMATQTLVSCNIFISTEGILFIGVLQLNYTKPVTKKKIPFNLPAIVLRGYKID